MIIFEECKKAGYPARTEENVLKSDVTLAFAIDFSSAGEKLTKRLCEKYKKLYINIGLANESLNSDRINRIIDKISINVLSNDVTLNIAGNGIYSLPKEQWEYNEWTKCFLYELAGRSSGHINFISGRTGGQTGMDEAGAIAMDFQKIPTIVLSPKGWLFRDENHKDIADEKLFKQRFNKQP